MFGFIFLEKKREGATRASISLDLVGLALFVLLSDQNKGSRDLSPPLSVRTLS